MQEGDTGIGGAILDEYWDNIPHSSFCTNWGNATKEQLGYAVKELHRIYVADMSAAAASTSKSKINYVSDYY